MSLPLPALLDEILATLGTAVVPLCLVLIGLSLAYSGIRGGLRGALVASALKLLALPALVLVVAHWGFGLNGTPLAVVVMAASLPTGSNALIFAQRYATLEVEGLGRSETKGVRTLLVRALEHLLALLPPRIASLLDRV